MHVVATQYSLWRPLANKNNLQVERLARSQAVINGRTSGKREGANIDPVDYRQSRGMGANGVESKSNRSCNQHHKNAEYRPNNSKQNEYFNLICVEIISIR